ncbi:MAG: hypothetical protein GY835_18615 [bacterium]|nr:hypothetical protein [bacterium]
MKKEEVLPPPKEKKKASQAEIRADNKAVGQQGQASAAVIRSSYGYSSVASRRTKAEIADEFHERNKLMLDNKQAMENRRIYQKHHDTHSLRRTACNKVFERGKLVSPGIAYSESKNRLERANLGSDREPPRRSAQGENSDYDTDADEKMQKVMAMLPPLPASSSMTLQLPATESGAGKRGQTPLPPPSQAGSASLGRQGIHKTPPPPAGGQAMKSPISPSVEKFFESVKAVEQKAE